MEQTMHGIAKVAMFTLASITTSALASPQSSDDSIAQMRGEITLLRQANADTQAQLAALRSEQGDKWLTETRAKEIKDLVRDVLSDSETRNSLGGSGATVGYDDGFFLSSPDGNWKFKINVLDQVRFVFNQNNVSSLSQSEWGFENRRTQLTFSGNMADPSWTYMIRLNITPEADPYDSAGVNLQDSWATKTLGNGFGFTAGQFKTPFMRESLMDDGVQLTAERSVVDYYFSSGYQAGIRLNYNGETVRFWASYGNGYRTAQMNGSGLLFQTQSWATGSTSFNIAGRAEYKVMGEWLQFNKESSFRGEGTGVLLGAAVGYENDRGADSNPAMIDPYSAIKWTADATVMFGGANISAAFVGQNTPHDATTNSVNPGSAVAANDYGYVVQGGYLFTDELEAFVRWEYFNMQNTQAGDGTTMENILTFGGNYYIARNRAKVTLDVGIPMSRNSNLSNDTFNTVQGAGWQDGTGQQWNIRAQFQVAF